MQPRQTAFKCYISHIVNGNYVKKEGEFEPNYIEINSKNKAKKISRVNIVANVVQKFESENKDYKFIVLDDGTASIRVKAWGLDINLFDDINIADIVLLMGKVKIYNNEIYLTPEIVKKVDINWELLRKLELLKEYGKPEIITTEIQGNTEVEKYTEDSLDVVEEVVENIEE